MRDHRDDTRVIGNAARFFRLSEPLLAGELLRRCQSLEAGDAKWSRSLGHLYASPAWGEQSGGLADWQFRALAELERSLAQVREESSRFAALVGLPRIALQAGDLEKARRYAEELLAAGPAQKDAASRGLAHYEGSIVLGWVALLLGHAATAKAWLIWAVTPAGRETRFIFGPRGPDLSLAKALLDRGERQAFLDFCADGDILNRRVEACWTGGLPRFKKAGHPISMTTQPNSTVPALRSLLQARQAKQFVDGTHRSISPATTLSRLAPHLAAMGITRVANITGLDRIGVPTAVAVRPNSRSLSVSQGKGLDIAAARASALMESIESFHAERVRLPMLFGNYEELHRTVSIFDPTDLPRARLNLFDESLALPWVVAHDVVSGEDFWLPYELCTPGSRCRGWSGVVASMRPRTDWPLAIITSRP